MSVSDQRHGTTSLDSVWLGLVHHVSTGALGSVQRRESVTRPLLVFEPYLGELRPLTLDEAEALCIGLAAGERRARKMLSFGPSQRPSGSLARQTGIVRSSIDVCHRCDVRPAKRGILCTECRAAVVEDEPRP
jgi:hypothetical protein